ncbi:MAG: hypothetical protein BWY54_00869 [Candidatus Dependentiae bacterium ADurb.Bin331]|nr:MAG: hypothetical protein BWY54_00869 [Candidatus Dependentiae bacterium ADurb.Bin331]
MKLFAKSTLLAVIFSIGTQQAQAEFYIRDYFDYKKHNMVKLITGSILTGVGLWTAYTGAVPVYGKVNTRFTSSPRMNSIFNHTPETAAIVGGSYLLYSGWNANLAVKKNESSKPD